MRYKFIGNIVTDTKIENGVVITNGDKIEYVGKDNNESVDKIFDYKDSYICSGLMDIHTHGALNFDFCESTPNEILESAKFHLKKGATTLLPTITSSSFDKTFKALENLEKAINSKENKNIVGAHLEGPYFSLNQCGAQDKTFITEPKKEDYIRLIERFGNIIKRWDYAPERDDGSFAKYLTEHNIIASAGHTDAKYNDMVVARDNGCNLITHFYSCTSTITREKGFRVLGVIEFGYLYDDMYIEIIADGKHLPKELLKLIFKIKDKNKIILVSDSLKVAGSNEKYSSVGTTKCVIEDGVCKLLDRSAFAGSIANANVLIKTVVNEGEVSLVDAIKMASTNPAKILGLNKGKLQNGFDADLVVLDKDLTVTNVVKNGEIIE